MCSVLKVRIEQHHSRRRQDSKYWDLQIYGFAVNSFESRALFTHMKTCWKFWGLPRKCVWCARGLVWKLIEIFGGRNYLKSDVLRLEDIRFLKIRSLLQKSPIKETIFGKRDLWFESGWPIGSCLAYHGWSPQPSWSGKGLQNLRAATKHAFSFFYKFWDSDYRQRFPLESTEIWRYRKHRFSVLKFPLGPLHSTRVSNANSELTNTTHHVPYMTSESRNNATFHVV